MKVFLSCVSTNKTIFGQTTPEQKNKMFLLESFCSANSITERFIPLVNEFMLDSGAFTFMSSGKHPSIDSYIERYIDFINRNDVQLFFEMDIDGLIGYEKVKQIRKRLEQETVKQPIPVWHKRLGIDEFKRMADEYPYVAIGGLASKEVKKSEHKYLPWFIKEAHKRGAKIHGLGYTDPKTLDKYHFDSVDSSTWLVGGRFGNVCHFDGRKISQITTPGKKVVDPDGLMFRNFFEWFKYQQYAKNHL